MSLSERFSLNLTDRYYHNRAAKNTAPPQTSTSATLASTSSPEPQLHNPERLAEETEAESLGPPATLQSQSHGPAELPDFMRGVRVFFYNLPASERKRLARYLITYPFRLDIFKTIL